MLREVFNTLAFVLTMAFMIWVGLHGPAHW